MEAQTLLLGGFGLLILLVAWFPIFIKKLPLTLPIICLSIGFAFCSLTGQTSLDPRDYPMAMSLLLEVTILISLAGAGLSIDKPLVWREWMGTARLLGITMPLSVGFIAALAALYLGFPWETAALIGAVLAPTDPVMAAEVRVGPPREGPEDNVRFSLTSEAGLNDGIGFPFTYLALGIAAHDVSFGGWLWDWLAVDVVWRIAAGLAAGWLIGKFLGAMVFRAGRRLLARVGQGFASLGITFVAYAGAELIQGYGFIAVFVAARMLRDYDDRHGYHHRLYDFTEQTERLLMMVVIVLFGASLAGPLLDNVTWEMVLGAFLILFMIRPATGMIGFVGSDIGHHQRAMISLFGIRGVGSFYYLAYAVDQESFRQLDTAWTFVSVVIVGSIVCYGVLSTPMMSWLDDRIEKKAG